MRTNQRKVGSRGSGKSGALFDDLWVKFSEYVTMEDGRIRPASGATMSRYEPWDDYASPTGKEARTQPYHSLLKLGDVADVHSSGSDEFRRATREFAREHGLLGILPHQLETIILPQRPSDENSPAFPFKQTVYVPTTTGWESEPIFTAKPNEPDDFTKRPGAFTRTGFEMTWQPLEDLCARFFPDLDPASLPRPLSKEFWAKYSEPLDLVWSAALQFRDAIEDARISPSPNRRQQLALTHLQELTVPVRFDLHIDELGKRTLRWVSHSLLAAFAMMAKLDLAQNRLLRCARPDCQVYFVTQSKAAKYHNTQCRKLVQMREYWKTHPRPKPKKNLKKKGAS
jgi:hypothetical protein